MTKLDIINKTGKAEKQIEFPKLFNENIRKDIILKVFEAKKYKQPYGPFEDAGKLYSASGILRRKRHSWKSTYGRAISRSPRKIMSRNGSNFTWVGATATYTRGGRRSHMPRPEEDQFNKINKKEYAIALKSALAGTANAKALEERFNIKIKNTLPLVVSADVLKLKTKEFIELLTKIYGSIDKIFKQKKVRAGRGKTRGRKYKTNSGLLFILSEKEDMEMSGITIKKVKDLTISDLAPNGVIGRIVIYTEEAIKELENKK